MAVDGAWLATLSPDQLGALILRPHPAARWCLFSDLPIYSIWTSNRLGMATTDEIVIEPNRAAVLGDQRDVRQVAVADTCDVRRQSMQIPRPAIPICNRSRG